MTLLHVDSFDDNLTDQGKYTSISSLTGIAGYSTTRRTGPLGWAVEHGAFGSTFGQLYRTFAVSDRHVNMVIGCAIKTTNGVGDASSLLIGLELDNGASIWAARLTDGTLAIRTNGGTNLDTSDDTYPEDIWMYLELDVTIGGSGSADLYANGALVATFSGDTTLSGGTELMGFRVGGAAISGSTDTIDFFDDLYVVNGAGSVNNGPLGDQQVNAIFPDDDGNYADWTPDAGTDHFSRVNEDPPDDDTSYVSSTTDADIDTYSCDPIISPGAVPGLVVRTWAKKGDASATGIFHKTRYSGTDDTGPEHVLTTTYGLQSTVFELDPAGDPWTDTSVNDSEFGVESNI